MDIVERESGFFREIDNDHPLNQDLIIPFMEAKGAYHIIADICNLKYIENGIFKEPGGIKYILTKYGFKNNVNYNYQIKYAAAVKELKQLRSDYSVLELNCNRKIKGTLRGLEDQIISKNKKIKNQADAVNSHREKIDKQAEQIKKQRDKIKELYMLINQNKDE